MWQSETIRKANKQHTGVDVISNAYTPGAPATWCFLPGGYVDATVSQHTRIASVCGADIQIDMFHRLWTTNRSYRSVYRNTYRCPNTWYLWLCKLQIQLIQQWTEPARIVGSCSTNDYIHPKVRLYGIIVANTSSNGAFRMKF